MGLFRILGVNTMADRPLSKGWCRRCLSRVDRVDRVGRGKCGMWRKNNQGREEEM
jgi:hypothetical protein